MRTWSRSVKLVVALSVAALGLTACSYGSERAAKSVTPRAALLAAVQSTNNAGSAHIDAKVALKLGSVNVNLAMHGAMNFDGSAGELAVTMPGSSFSTRELFVNKALYMQVDLPGVPAALKGKWFVLDLAKFIKNPGMLRSLGGGALPNFKDNFGALGTSNGLVKKVGTQTVNGKTYDVYQLTLSLASMAKALSGFTSALGSVASLADPSLMNTGVNATAYVDSNNQLAREVVHVVVPVAGQTLDESVDMSFTNIGTKVDVQAPPASDTWNFSTLVQGITGLFSS